MSLSAVVLAAGEGKRLRTTRAKVLHEAGGRALIEHVLAALDPLGADPVVVVIGHLREQLERHLAGRGLRLSVQDPPRGTGDAVAVGCRDLPSRGEVLVLSGDVPLITTATLERLLEARRARGAAAALATAVLAEPGGYGRVLRDAAGDVTGIVEARDATPEQRAVREVNAGTYAFDLAALRPALARLVPDNDQGEYYLTDVIADFVAARKPVVGVELGDPVEMAGVNRREELAEVHRLLNRRTLARLMAEGVTVLDPGTTWVDADCVVGRDTVLEPGVHLRYGCVLGEGCRVGAHSVLESASLAPGHLVPPLTVRLSHPAGRE